MSNPSAVKANKIFVSYASQDRARVALLVRELEKHSLDVWWDEHIPKGSAFDREIEQAIESSCCIIVFWTASALESEWVRNEANEGLERDILVPVLLDLVRVPLAFRRMQAVDLAGYPQQSKPDGLAQLLSAVKSKVSRASTPVSQAIPVDTAARREVTLITGELLGTAQLDDPEDLAEFLSQVRRRLMRLVELYGGVLNLMGNNRYMILFGLPVEHEEDARRAVHLAWALPEELLSLVDELKSKGLDISVRSSVTTGLVVADSGGALAGSYNLTGECVAEGEHMLAAAKPGQILLTQTTLNEVAPYFETRPLPPVSLQSGSLTPHLLVGLSDIRTRIEASGARGFSRYSGRTFELSLAVANAKTALLGRGRALALVGDPGIGKSRFAHELIEALEDERFLLLEGSCQSYGTRSPYFPFLDALDALLRDDTISGDPEQTLLQALTDLGAPLEKVAPGILHLFAIESQRFPAPQRDGSALRMILQNAIVTVFTLAARKNPLLLFLEDWHWADNTSDDLLQSLIDLSSRLPIFLLITARSGYQPRWLQLAHTSVIHLPPLSSAETGDLIAGVLDMPKPPHALVEQIHETTDGNPFFIEEICRSLKEREQAPSSEGNLTLADVEAMRLPSSVQSVIRSRLDRLADNTRQVLGHAAVIGREFSQELLESWLGFAVDRALGELTDLSVIRQTELLPVPLFEFTHALTQVVVYDSMLRSQRRKLHDSLGHTMKRNSADGLIEDDVGLLAHHFGRGNDIPLAVQYALLAGENAVDKSATQEASSYFGRAVELIRTLDANLIDVRQRVSALVSYGNSLMVVKGYGAPEVIASFSEALSLCDELEMRREHFTTIWGLWRYYYNRGLINQALELSGKLVTIAEAETDPELLQAAYTAHGIAKLLAGKVPEAVESIEAAIEQVTLDDARVLALRYGMSPLTMSLCFLAVARANQGIVDQANEMVVKACLLADELEHDVSRALAHYYAVTIGVLLGERELAVHHSQILSQVAKDANFPHWIALADFQAALMRALAGDVQPALKKMRHARDQALSLGVGLLRPTYAFTLVSMVGPFVSTEEAQAELVAVGEAIEIGGLNFFLPDLYRSRAILTSAEDPIRAEKLFRSAIDLSDRSGSSLSKLRSALDYAAFLRKNKREADAVELLEEVLADFGQQGNEAASYRHALRMLREVQSNS